MNDFILEWALVFDKKNLVKESNWSGSILLSTLIENTKDVQIWMQLASELATRKYNTSLERTDCRL